MLPPLTPFIKRVLIALLATYIGTIVLEKWVGLPVLPWLAFELSAPSITWLWTWLTHIWVAPSSPSFVFFHLISLVFLWWVLAPFDARFGNKHTTRLWVQSSLAAAVAGALGGALPFAIEPPLYGVGPVILAAITAYARTLPPGTRLSLFGALQMTPKQLVGAVIGLSIIFFLTTKHFAHLLADLGAVAAGWWHFQIPNFGKAGRPKRPQRNPRGFRVVKGGGGTDNHDGDKPRWLN